MLYEQPTNAPTRKVKAGAIGSVGGGLSFGVPIATIAAYYIGQIDPNMPEPVLMAFAGIISSIITTIFGVASAWVTKELKEHG